MGGKLEAECPAIFLKRGRQVVNYFLRNNRSRVQGGSICWQRSCRSGIESAVQDLLQRVGTLRRQGRLIHAELSDNAVNRITVGAVRTVCQLCLQAGAVAQTLCNSPPLFTHRHFPAALILRP